MRNEPAGAAAADGELPFEAVERRTLRLWGRRFTWMAFVAASLVGCRRWFLRQRWGRCRDRVHVLLVVVRRRQRACRRPGRRRRGPGRARSTPQRAAPRIAGELQRASTSARPLGNDPDSSVADDFDVGWYCGCVCDAEDSGVEVDSCGAQLEAYWSTTLPECLRKNCARPVPSRRGGGQAAAGRSSMSSTSAPHRVPEVDVRMARQAIRRRPGAGREPPWLAGWDAAKLERRSGATGPTLA